MKKISLLVLPFLISCSRSGTTVSPARKDIIETVYASGKIIPENEYHVYALTNGTVKEKLVEEGDAVLAGAVLYKINNDAPLARLDAAKSLVRHSQENLSDQSRILNDIRLNMESAAAKFTNDSLNYFRLKNLLEQNAASKSSVDNAYTLYSISLNQKKSAAEKYYATQNELGVALKNAKGQAATAQTDADNYTIKSEFDGIVFQLMKEAGEAVRAGEIVALLGEKSRRIIKLSVDQQDIDKIKKGQEVLLRSDVAGNAIFHATIIRIYPVMNEVDQTFRVDAIFKETQEQQFVHSSVEANIIIQEKKNALVIPRAAMVAEDSAQVKVDGKLKNVFVQTGVQTLDDVEILGGLEESSEVIIPGQK
ncbi:MAG: HlyD family efflux transporter periplasmic adaptor subunit [Bacteroidota bacterium]